MSDDKKLPGNEGMVIYQYIALLIRQNLKHWQGESILPGLVSASASGMHHNIQHYYRDALRKPARVGNTSKM